MSKGRLGTTQRAQRWPLLAFVPAVVLAGFLALTSAGSAQSQTSLFIDVVTAGNSAASVGAVDDCVEVDVGDTVLVDIGVNDVSDLTAWETTLVFDQEVLELEDRDPRMFLANEANSRLTVQSDLSAPTSLHPGGLFIGAADLSTGAVESGSGILARVTFKAIDEGTSNAWLPQLDVDSNGRADVGSSLLGIGGASAPIGDVNYDLYFDGDVSGAVIVVGGDCSETEPPAPTAPPTPGPPPTEAPDATGGGTGGGSGGGTNNGSDSGDETPTPPSAVRDPEDDDGPEDRPGGGTASTGDGADGSSGLSLWVWLVIGSAAVAGTGGALAFALGAYRRRYP